MIISVFAVFYERLIQHVSFIDVFVVVVHSFILNIIVLLDLLILDWVALVYHRSTYHLKIVVLSHLRYHFRLLMYSVVSIVHIPSGFYSLSDASSL